MDIKFLIDGKEERKTSGIIPTEGNIVELKKDGKSKLYDVVLISWIHLKSVEVDDLDKIGVVDE